MNITPEIPQLDPMRVQVRKHALLNEISTRPSRKWWRIAVPSTGLAAAAAVTALVWPVSTPSAFASWTAEPRAPGAGASADADRCRQAFAELVVGVPEQAVQDSTIPLKPWSPETALVDQRGNITLVVLTGPRALGYCLYTSEYSILGTGGPKDDDQFRVVGTQAGHGPADKEPASVLLGHVGAEVHSVRVDTADGRQVTATIDKGWVAAWWPSRAEATKVTLYDVNGNTLRTAVPENR